MEVEALNNNNKPTTSSLATTTTTTSVETTTASETLLGDRSSLGSHRGAIKSQRLKNNNNNNLQSKSTVTNGKSSSLTKQHLTNGHSKKVDHVDDESSSSSSSSSLKEMTAKTDNENLSSATAGRSVSPTKLLAAGGGVVTEKKSTTTAKTPQTTTTTRATRKSLQLLNNKTNNCNDNDDKSTTSGSSANKTINNNVITEDENAMDGFVVTTNNSNETSRVVVTAAESTTNNTNTNKKSSSLKRSASLTKSGTTAVSNTSLIHTLIREETENEDVAVDDDVNMDTSCSVNMIPSSNNNNNQSLIEEESITMLDNNSMDVSSQQQQMTNDASGVSVKKARRKKRSSLIVNGQFNQGHVEVNKLFVYKWPISETEEEAFKSNLEQIQKSREEEEEKRRQKEEEDGGEDDGEASQNSVTASRSATQLAALNNTDPLWKIYLSPSGQDELYVLQEQISEYLQVKSFKRKYPDIERRLVDVKEREFLRHFRIVTETQCDLGLNALRLGDVLDLMGDEYPDKYAEFSAHLAEKKRRAVTIAKTNAMQLLAAQQQSEEDNNSNSCSNLMPSVAMKKSDPAYAAQRMKEMIRKAVLSASNYNRQLVKEKREERRTCFDLQTLRVFKPRREVHQQQQVQVVGCTKGPYPVALIHGQYQNYYKRYSSGELKYLPLNTAIYETEMPKKLEYLESKRPPARQHPQQQHHHHHASSTLRRASTVSAHLTSGSSPLIRHVLEPTGSPLPQLARRPTLDQDSNTSHTKHTTPLASSIISTSSSAIASSSRYSIRITASPASKTPSTTATSSSSSSSTILKTCYLCQKECQQPVVSAQAAQFSDKNNDILIDCSSCSRSAHPLCLELNPDLVDWVCIRQYEWQCLDCKKCSQCDKSHDEDKMMFCDRCDRGFHTYCVGVARVPDGAWLCLKCKQFKERLASINEKINAMKQHHGSTASSNSNSSNHNNHQQQQLISPRPTINNNVSSSISSSAGSNNKIRQIMTTSVTTTPVASNHHHRQSHESVRQHASQVFGSEKRGRGRPPGSTNKPKDTYSPKKLKQEFGNKPHKINSMMMNGGYNQPSPTTAAYDPMDSNSMMSTGSASTPAIVYNSYGDSASGTAVAANSSLENYYSYGGGAQTAVYIQPQQ